jgi:hypothetical protein
MVADASTQEGSLPKTERVCRSSFWCVHSNYLVNFIHDLQPRPTFLKPTPVTWWEQASCNATRLPPAVRRHAAQSIPGDGGSIFTPTAFLLFLLPDSHPGGQGSGAGIPARRSGMARSRPVEQPEDRGPIGGILQPVSSGFGSVVPHDRPSLVYSRTEMWLRRSVITSVFAWGPTSVFALLPDFETRATQKVLTCATARPIFQGRAV